MRLTQAVREGLLKKVGNQESMKDTGAAESQAAFFTHRIEYLTNHLKLHKKDNASRRGLIKIVGKRKRILSYLSKVNLERYRAIIATLGLRK